MYILTGCNFRIIILQIPFSLWVLIGIIAFFVIRFMINVIIVLWPVRSSKKPIKKEPRPTPEEITQPERPTTFGYKGTWLAVKGSDAHEIATAAGVRNLQPCNWTYGIEKAYYDGVFITPPIDGWTLLVSQANFPDADSQEGLHEVKRLLNDLSSQFGEAQYFGTHRGVGYAAWLRSVNGTITRAYSIADGETFIVEGKPTPIEQSYHLIDTLSEEAKEPGYSEREDITYPCEEEVMTIAGAWSVNPSNLQGRQDLGPGLGLIGRR
jgi:hypothetical protein